MRFIFTLLFILSLPALAEDSLIEALSNKAKKIERLSGSFIQERKIAVLPLPLISEGEFSYHHLTGMVWHTFEPVQSKVSITSQGMQLEGNESAPRDMGSAQLSKTLLALFSGNLQPLSEQFHIEADGSLTEWHLHLTPKNEMVAAQITSIDIRGKDTTESVVIADANGDHSKLTFITHQPTLLE